MSSMSGVYFEGATIDYINGPLNGSAFTIKSFNTKSNTIRCGSSAF